MEKKKLRVVKRNLPTDNVKCDVFLENFCLGYSEMEAVDFAKQLKRMFKYTCCSIIVEEQIFG